VAAIPEFLMPPDATRLKVGIGELAGGGRWLVKLLGDLNGDGQCGVRAEHWLPLNPASSRSWLNVQLHPGLRRSITTPLERLELVVEGPPGAYAVFERVDFE
jgi:hypothetical protein